MLLNILPREENKFRAPPRLFGINSVYYFKADLNSFLVSTEAFSIFM